MHICEPLYHVRLPPLKIAFRSNDKHFIVAAKFQVHKRLGLPQNPNTGGHDRLPNGPVPFATERRQGATHPLAQEPTGRRLARDGVHAGVEAMQEVGEGEQGAASLLDESVREGETEGHHHVQRGGRRAGDGVHERDQPVRGRVRPEEHQA